MINIKRLPGLIFTHKWKTACICGFVCIIVYLLHEWGIVCTNYHAWREIDKLCARYKRKEASGTLCAPLCIDHNIESISCTPAHAGKELVFTAKWSNTYLVFKSANNIQEIIQDNKRKLLWTPTDNKYNRRQLKWNHEAEILMHKQQPYPRHFPKKTHNKERQKTNFNELSEVDFDKIIRDIITTRLNISISNSQLQNLKYLNLRNKYVYDENSLERRLERLDILQLLKSQEYLLSTLFSDRNVFPQVLGTCGNLYAVEHLNVPRISSIFVSDEKEEWIKRRKLAIMILDLLEEVETNFPDALHLCDIKMNHFGYEKNNQKLKFLDLDSVYTNNVLERLISKGRSCVKDDDCDWFDCKSVCNTANNMCEGGVVNNNLQVVCEKIFIGWTMSGKMIIPGLLMSEHTPDSLAMLLRQCAQESRGPVPEDIRQKLYTILTEMDQE